MNKKTSLSNDTDNEKIIWKGNPSQWVNFYFFFMVLLLLPGIGLAIEKYACKFNILPCDLNFITAALLATGLILSFVRFLKTYCHVYEISDQRIIEKTGIISRKTDELELYRVIDIRHEEPFNLRIFGRSNIVLNTSDFSNPQLLLKGIKNGRNMKETLRKAVDIRRDVKYVREIGISQTID